MKGFVILSLTVLIVIGVWVGVLAATNGGIPNIGTVSGQLLNETSPFPLSVDKNFKPHPMAGTVRAVQGSRVVVRMVVGISGNFQLQLPPGVYWLEGTFPDAAFGCRASDVRIRASLTTDAVVACFAPLG